MFWAFSRPSPGAQQLPQQPLILPLECGDSSAVGRGRAGLPTLQIIATGGQNYHFALFQTILLAIPTKHKQHLLIILFISAVSLRPLNALAINLI
jgi:hypothetical protein